MSTKERNEEEVEALELTKRQFTDALEIARGMAEIKDTTKVDSSFITIAVSIAQVIATNYQTLNGITIYSEVNNPPVVVIKPTEPKDFTPTKRKY